MTGTMSSSTEDLIDRLAAEALAVQPLRPPLRRAVAWLLVAAIVIGGVVAMIGFRPDLEDQMARPAHLLEWLASLLTGILSAVAAFHVSLPDRSRRWAFLPVPPLIIWIGAVGYGGVADRLGRGSRGFLLGTSFDCFLSILVMSVPLAVALLVMLRYAGPVPPTATIATGMLAAAALAATGLTLFHPLDASIMVLIWHGGTIALLVGLATLANWRLFALVSPDRSAGA